MSEDIHINCPRCDEVREGDYRETIRWWTVHCTTHQWWYRLGKLGVDSVRRLWQVLT